MLQCPVGEIVSSSNTIIIFRQDQPIAQALSLLSGHGILSAPVCDSEGKQLIGQVDVLDILSFVLSVNTHRAYWTEEMRDRFKRPVGEAIDASLIDPFFPVASSTPFCDVVKHFFSYGIHRVPVVDSRGDISGIFSQTDAMEFISNHIDSIDWTELMNKSVLELDLAPGKVTSVTDDCALLHAFTILTGCEISAVPIVSATDGSLVGTLSCSDFKDVYEGNLPVLTNSIRNYMTHEPLTCTLNTPLRDIIELLATSGVHRVYVTEGNPKKPVGVVSMTDIMKLLANRLC